ncbi:MAG TPA: FAD-binding oxidoreductase [Leptolyngbyaceae cyanobacterium M33_DOE_097]|uniref:FAD-binding oxidoreductase n=1 Tax=Oscillatoriales cyanobacterium SpSt-418 TaxID=2282169 RepID=A0A7C3PIN3_9CYAN|nr:FAD-binding oxidoreductase [Leptolyngbyaceae cyanobacterium M33_DOE_097]
MAIAAEILAQVPGNPWAGLQRVDALWQQLREFQTSVPPVVSESAESIEPNWDVVICGGTLGILIGAALAQQGWRVALIERGILRGRQQEWNISRRELQTFVDLQLLSEAELDQAIATQYNPARIQFFGGSPVWVRDVLNIGVDPVYLLETLKQRFLQAGGKLLEQTGFQGAIVHPNGVSVQISEQTLTTRLLLDAMGHFSPISRQARQGKTPDAVCLVVGTCATGFPENQTGDLIASFTPIQHQCQYFWEAFPARDGRTTYLFTYVDAHPSRFSLEFLFDEYFRLLPEYQGVSLEQLQFQRALFGFFPSYRQSPLKPQWNHILAIGDSSGSQSPLSFGGFGAMVRHLHRLSHGIQAALQANTLDRTALRLLQPYQPNLAVTWLFQKTMSVGVDQSIAPNQINDLLNLVFGEMAALGEPVLKPFLQDVVQFPALFQTLAKTTVAHPLDVVSLLPQMGIPALADWLRHYATLAGYTALLPVTQALKPFSDRLSDRPRFFYQQWLEALKYGSGADYHP